MRSMGTRRVALFAGAASVAAVALAGCSAGQVAETALKNPSTYGVNVDNADGSIAVRGLAVTYVSSKGYLSGSNAPLEVSLFNQTRQPITVQIGSRPLAGADASQGVVSARSVGLVGGTPPSGPGGVEPTGSREAARPLPTASDPTGADPVGSPDPSAAPPADASGAVEPSAMRTAGEVRIAQFTIAPLDSVIFRPGDDRSLQLIGLSGPLVPGNSVNLIFAFSNGTAPLVVQAPVSVPLSPAPRGSAENEGVGADEGH